MYWLGLLCVMVGLFGRALGCCFVLVCFRLAGLAVASVCFGFVSCCVGLGVACGASVVVFTLCVKWLSTWLRLVVTGFGVIVLVMVVCWWVLAVGLLRVVWLCCLVGKCLVILVIFDLGWLVGISAICFVSCLAVNSVVHFVYIYVVWCFVLDLFTLRFDACVVWICVLLDCGFC